MGAFKSDGESDQMMVGHGVDLDCPKSRVCEDTAHRSSYVREVLSGTRRSTLEVLLQRNRDQVVCKSYNAHLEEEFEYHWWLSDDLVELLWGQLNVGVYVLEKKFYCQAIHALLMDEPTIGYFCENTALLRTKMREIYQDEYDLDRIVMRKPNYL